MRVSRHAWSSGPGRQACTTAAAVRQTLLQPTLTRPLNPCLNARRNTNRPRAPLASVEQPGRGQQQRVPAAAASAPSAQSSIEYQVSDSSISISVRGGNNGTCQQLLRLQEASADSEYVLLLPAALAGVLLEVLERAVQCVETGNDGRPLELQHTVLQGSRTFRCSLVYTAPPSSSSSSSSSVQQQLVTVSVQEVGRSCVHLPVGPTVLQPVGELLQLLRAVSGQQQQQQQVPPTHFNSWPGASVTPAASVPGTVTVAAANTAADASATTSAAQSAAANAATGTVANNAAADPTIEASPAAVGADLPADSAAASQQAGEKSDTVTSGTRSDAEPLPATAPDASPTATPSAAAAASSTAADASTAANTRTTADASTAADASAAAGTSTRTPSSAPAAPEVLFAAISSSTSIGDGFKFAHAAAAEALSSSSSSSSSSTRLFTLPHLCCLWQKLPGYAAGLQREALQLGLPGLDESLSDEEVLAKSPLHPEAHQELQALLDIQVPLMQPHLPSLPKHMLQRLLQAARDAQLQLPGNFLEAWAAAAVSPSARGAWEADGNEGGVQAVLEVTELLLEVGQGTQQQQQQHQAAGVLPMQWCAHALAETACALQTAVLHSVEDLVDPDGTDSLNGPHSDQHAEEGGPQQQQQQQLEVLQQLVPVLLAACGNHLQQRQLLWQPWGDSDNNSSSSSSSRNESYSAAAFQASVSCSLQQLLSVDVSPQGSHQQGSLGQALLPGIQQGLVTQWLLMLQQQQQAAAAGLVWSWLVCSGGAQAMDSALLRQLIEALPYDRAAAAYVARLVSSSSGSSRQVTLLECVLVAHASSYSTNTDGVADVVLQVESLSGLVAHALRADTRAAFAALPSILSALTAAASSHCHDDSSSSSSSSERWDAVVAELCVHMQQMLHMGPQQLLAHGTTVLTTLSQLSTAQHATSKSLLHVLQLTQQIAPAADSWHAAADTPDLHQQQQQQQLDEAMVEQVPTAAVVAGCIEDAAPAFARVCARQQQQQQQQQAVLPALAELLAAAAELQEQHGEHRTLAPAWLTQPTSTATAVLPSSSSSSSSSPWAAFEPVLLAEAGSSGLEDETTSTALDAADIATAAAALFVLGVQPSPQLLQAYWTALGPEVLGLSALGLQQLLWTAAALLNHDHRGCDNQQQQQQQQHDGPSASTSTKDHSYSNPLLLRLASKACSSLAVRSSSALTARQAARVTWALVQLSHSQAATAAAWSPPQQVISWLGRVWEGMASRTAGPNPISSRVGTAAAAGALESTVHGLLESKVLQQQEVDELLCSLQQLALLRANQQQEQQQQDEASEQQEAKAATEEQQQGSELQFQQTEQTKGQQDKLQAPQPERQQEQQQQAHADQAAQVPPQPQQQQQQQQPPKSVSAAQTAQQALLAQQQKLKRQQGEQQQEQQDSRHTVHIFGNAMPKAAVTSSTAELLPVSGLHEDIVADSAQDAASAAAAGAASSAAAAAPDAPVTSNSDQDGSFGNESSDTAAAAAAALEAGLPPPVFVDEALQQIQQADFKPSQKQALQLLLPVQQYMSVLPPEDALLYVSACFRHKVPLSPAALAAAAAAATPAAAAAGASAAGISAAQNTPVPASLVLQLLSAIADAITVAPTTAAAAAAAAAAMSLRQQSPSLLQQLLPALKPQQLSAASAGELLQLLRDAYTLSTGSKPPSTAGLSVGTTLFGSSAVTSSSSGGSNSSRGPQGVSQAWVAAVAAALQPKLLLFPHASQLLQCLQLLQALGHHQPSSTFMGSFLAAADALVDTLSGRNCLELLAATAAAGQLPSRPLTAAVLQHVGALRLAPADVAAGCRLLAALSIRPSGDLLLHWFELTEASAERLRPQEALQMLWACCVWRVQPLSSWLDAVIKALMPAGRLSSCAPSTLAGLCRCLWQLGVQPAPGFVAAVAAAAEYTIHAALQAHAGATPSSSSSSSSGGWQYWQQGKQQQQQQQTGAAMMDAESLSVLCYCLNMWQHSGTPAWNAAVTDLATALMPAADGPSLLRLGVHLAGLYADADGGGVPDDEMLPWQEALLEAVPQLLSTSPSQEIRIQPNQVDEVVVTGDGTAAAAGPRQVPAWGLVLLCQVLDQVPVQSLPVLKSLTAAGTAAATQGALTTLDANTLVLVNRELLGMLEAAAEAAEGPFMQLKLQQLQAEADAAYAAAGDLLKYAYQRKDGAPADALALIPFLAAELGVEMPQESVANLQAAAAAARDRQQQLQQALMLQGQGGPAVLETLLQGWDELGCDDPAEVVERYAAAPLQAAVGRRVRWLGAAVSDEWVLQGLSG